MRAFMQGVAAVAIVIGFGGGCAARTMPFLNDPIQNMSTAQIQAAVQSLTFDECRKRERTSKTSIPPRPRTRVEICAVTGGENAGGPSTPTTGVWVARMINLGADTTDRWELRPGSYESWIVVYGPAPVKYAIVEIPSMPSTESPRMIVSAGNYRACGHPQVPSHARANFGNCNDHPRDHYFPGDSRFRRTASFLRDALLPKKLLAQGPGSLDGPAWIDCGGDCCVTD